MAAGGIGLEIQLHQIVDPPAAAGIDAEKVAILLVGTRFEVELGIGKGATLHHTADTRAGHCPLADLGRG